MRLAVPIAIVALATVLLCGCGSGSDEGSTPNRQERAPAAPVGASARSCETLAVDVRELRATGISCERARAVMYGWQRDSRCAAAAGASRGGCTVRSYRCIGATTGRGAAVSCSRPGRSIAFTVPRD